MKQAHIDSLREQLAQWKRNLSRYELEEAKAGGHLSAALANDIDAARKRINELEAAIDAVAGGQDDDGLIATYNSVFALIAHIDREVRQLKEDVERQGKDIEEIRSRIDPPLRVMVGRAVFWLSLFVAGVLWLVFESRTFMIENPAQAIVITVSLVLFAFLVRWLPEDGQ